MRIRQSPKRSGDPVADASSWGRTQEAPRAWQPTEDKPAVRRYVVTIGISGEDDPVQAAKAVAAILQEIAPGIDGTVVPSVGFGGWGVEAGAQVTTTSRQEPERFRETVSELLRLVGGKCAYVEHDNTAWEWTVDGSVSRIQGFRG